MGAVNGRAYEISQLIGFLRANVKIFVPRRMLI